MNKVCDNTTENYDHIWKFSMLRTTNHQCENYMYLTLLSVSYKIFCCQSTHSLMHKVMKISISSDHITVQGKCRVQIEDPSSRYFIPHSGQNFPTWVSLRFNSEVEYLTELSLLVFSEILYREKALCVRIMEMLHKLWP